MKLILGAVFAFALVAANANDDFTKIRKTMPTTGKVAVGRVIGGQVVTPNSIPYQVALFLTASDGTYFCGGSLLSKNYVLTAAHCVSGISSIRVILGDHDIRATEGPEVTLISTEFAAHAQYDPEYLTNDIAWVKLPESVEFTDAIQPVTLPKKSDSGNYEGLTGTISGWGKTADSDAGTTDLLRSTQADIMEWDTCSNYYYPGVVTANTVCTNPNQGHGSCNGDSGGPLTINGVQVGIVSFGASSGCVAAPSAFTRVHSFLDWIADHTDVVIA